jgi:hypothetical protein
VKALEKKKEETGGSGAGKSGTGGEGKPNQDDDEMSVD